MALNKSAEYRSLSGSINIEEEAASGGNITLQVSYQNNNESQGTGEVRILNSGSHNDEKEGGYKRARNKLIWASILCFLFTIAQVIGGYYSNSLAIATDAAHMCTDFFSLLISILGLHLAKRPISNKLSFGWHRAEVLGSLISVLLIWTLTGVLDYIAILRIMNLNFEIKVEITLINAAAGLYMNVIMAFILHQTESATKRTSHSISNGSIASGEGSSLERSGGNRPKVHNNINVRAAFVHFFGDFFQYLGVIIAAYIMYYRPEYKILDPICTFLFSFLVLLTTVNILRDIINVIMEATPRGIDFNEVKNSFFMIRGVKEVHNLRIWSLTMGKIALSAHLAIENGSNSQDILKRATSLVQRRFDVVEFTFQIEEYADDMLDFSQCRFKKLN